MLRKLFTTSVVVMTIFWAVGLAAFVPTAQAASSGDLIKASLPAVYYYGADNQRYVFPDQKTYMTWYDDFSGVVTISDEELAAIPIGGNVTAKPGAKMVKITTDPKVYAVDPNGTLRWVETAEIAECLYGENWASMINDVPDPFFTNYTSGDPISDCADYDPAGFPSDWSINDDKGLEDGFSGNLSVTLASDTPNSTTVPANGTAAAANVVMTKVNFTAGPEPVTITGLNVKRGGLSQDAAINVVKLFDGSRQIGTSQSLNSVHKATFNNISIEVPANGSKTISLAATLTASATYSGNIINLGIDSVDDVEATGNVSGTFPVVGNDMTLTSSVTIGTATLYNGSLGTRNTTDLTVDPDDTDVRFTQVKINAGSAEGLIIKQVTAVKNGTAASSDVTNIRLVNDNTGETIGTVDNLDSDGRAVFSNLELAIAKGGYVELSVIADINNSGSGRTIAFDLHDGVSYTMLIEGQSYGFGITPTRNNFCAAGGTCTAQTINQGYLTIQKSADTPATGNIALGGTGVVLGVFDYTASGEDINVTQTQIKLTPAGGGSAEDYTNVTIYDGDGSIVAGPQDGSTAAADTAETLTFTDAYTVPAGTTSYTVKANVSSNAVASETITASMPSGSITAKGASSAKTTYTTSSGTTVPPASAVTANTMTIQGPDLNVITAATPVGGNLVTNAQNQTFAHIDLDATASGEDVKVTSVMVQDSVGGTGAVADLNNLELWGDPDNTDDDDTSVRLETTNSTATNAATVTFTFKTPLRVEGGSISRLTLLADVVSGSGTEIHTFNVDGTSATVTSTGWTTGSDITEDYSGNGQSQTLQPSGSLKVTKAADMAAAAQLTSGTNGVEVMKYKFTSSWEPIDVTTIPLYLNDANVSDVAKVYVYVDGELVGSTSGYTFDPITQKVSVVLDSGTLVVPRDGYSYVTLKIDMGDKNSVTTSTTARTIGIGDETGDGSDWGGAGSYNITATGQSSGATITATDIDSVGDGSGNVYGSNNFTMHKGTLSVALASDSPAATQGAGAGKEVIRLVLTATGDEITVLDIEYVKGGTATVTGTGEAKWCEAGSTGSCTSTTYYSWASGTAWLNAGRNWTGGTAGATLAVGEGSSLSIALNGDTGGAGTNETLQYTIDGSTLTSGLKYEDSSGVDIDLDTTLNLPVNGNTLTY